MKQSVFSTRFREAVAEKCMTHRELSDATGVSIASISNYSSGEYQPTMQTGVILARYLGVSMDWLYGLSDVKKPAQATQK